MGILSLPQWGAANRSQGRAGGSLRRHPRNKAHPLSTDARRKSGHAGLRAKNAGRGRKPCLTALVALFALAIHTLAVAGGAIASDGAAHVGGIICTAHGPQSTPAEPQRPAPHERLPGCCLAGCPVAGGHGALSSSPSVVAAPAKFIGRLSPTPDAGNITRFLRSPNIARAPPLEFRML